MVCNSPRAACQVRCHEFGSRCRGIHELSCAAIEKGNKAEGDDCSSRRVAVTSNSSVPRAKPLASRRILYIAKSISLGQGPCYGYTEDRQRTEVHDEEDLFGNHCRARDDGWCSFRPGRSIQL